MPPRIRLAWQRVVRVGSLAMLRNVALDDESGRGLVDVPAMIALYEARRCRRRRRGCGCGCGLVVVVIAVVVVVVVVVVVSAARRRCAGANRPPREPLVRPTTA